MPQGWTVRPCGFASHRLHDAADRLPGSAAAARPDGPRGRLWARSPGICPARD
ncbi:hypothetical protein SUS17_2798 [Sphingomonas sp. S17]|nr:hypothetical protein SUS17_2798 [Sphingomonas sp. S17]